MGTFPDQLALEMLVWKGREGEANRSGGGWGGGEGRCQEGGLWRKRGGGEDRVAEEDLGHRCGGEERQASGGGGVGSREGGEASSISASSFLLLTQCTTPFLRASSLWASLLFYLVWFLF